MRWFKVFITMAAIGVGQQLHAAVYVDPSSTGMLMTVLAPIFILVSALGLHFKRSIKALLRRFFNKSGLDGEKH